MSGPVFLKLQSPTVRIPCSAVGPDGTDTLQVTFKRYPTDIAQEKLTRFNECRYVDLKPIQTLEDDPSVNADELVVINRAIKAENLKARDNSETELAKILFSEIVDIDGLQDSEGNPVPYKDASDEERSAIYRVLSTSNPYILALVAGYTKALINVGEARSKN